MTIDEAVKALLYDEPIEGKSRLMSRAIYLRALGVPKAKIVNALQAEALADVNRLREFATAREAEVANIDIPDLP